jgi:hypothetical protein
MSEDETKKEEEDTKKDLKKDLKKDEKIPNSLIIYVKTRIPNYYKMTYDPFMTVPKTKSHTIYFDPLIKYYEGPIKSIPSNAHKDALYTQFFEAAEFDSMINRILSDFRYMQKPRTLQESFDQHIIDNNIKFTLETLFESNSLFYINKKPYTIVGSHWKNSDWQIDKKPIEKLLEQFSNTTVNKLEEEAKQEEDDIPEALRQGNLASTNLTEEENIVSVASGLQNTIDKVNSNKDKEDKNVLKGEIDSFVHQDNLPGVSKDLKRLFSEFLIKNIPINYSDIPDLARDPLTLSLLVDPAELLKFINENKKTVIVELYSSYITAKTNLQMVDKEYTDACTEMAIYKTTFDSEINKINEQIMGIQLNPNPSLNKKEKNEIIQQITLLKMGYMKIIFKIADAIMAIYEKQNVYFVSTKLLLEGLKDDYINIIKYYEKPELAIKCIEYDISVMNSLIQIDQEDTYSVSYFSNYDDFKKFYENTLYANQTELLEPKINYREEEHYFTDKDFLFIEQKQYEIYNFKMFLFYSYNQFSIWVSLFKSIQIFANFIGKEALQILQNSETTLTKYDEVFPGQQQQDFIDRIKADGLRSSFNNLTKKFDWFLVKEDGQRCIESDKLVPNKKKPLKLMEDEMQEKLYISYIKSQVQAYDAVVLYIHLLEVVCLRQNRVYVAEENVNQLNLEFSLTLTEYYDSIENSIESDLDANILDARIPISLLWDTKGFNDPKLIYQKQKINDKSSIIYRGRLKSINKSRQTMVDSCEQIADIITPNLSEQGFITKCQLLLMSNLTDIKDHSFRSSYWLEKTINNYNNEATSDFIYNMNYVVKDARYDSITEDIEPEEYLDWIVYNNSGTNTNDTIYSAISDALNGQLDLDGQETTNPYTEEIDGKQRFTISSLKRIISDSNNEPEISSNEIINILQEVLKIKFIVFEMFPRENTVIQLGDIVTYNKTKQRVVGIVKGSSAYKPTFTLYNGISLQREIPEDEIELTKSNLNSHFRIDCNFVSSSKDELYDDNIYLVLSKQNGNTFNKYRLVKNSSNNNFIIQTESIPIYITYFIYNNCARFNKDKIVSSFDNQFEKFTKTIQDQIETPLTEENLTKDKEKIQKEKDKIDYKIGDVEGEYFRLRNIENKTQEEKTQELLLKQDVIDLRDRSNRLRDVLGSFTSPPSTGTWAPNPRPPPFNPVPNPVPNPASNPASNSASNPFNPAPNPRTPPSNPNPNPKRSRLKFKTQTTGGDPSDQYANPYQTQNPYYNQNPYQNQNPYYNQNPYQNQNPYYNNNTMYLPRRQLPYNVSQNKAKDTKSKLSFYITIELELFPGKSANLFQKSVIKCQSTFERIREAYAEIRGFQYRPSAVDYYENNDKNNQIDENKNNKKTVTEKNKKYNNYYTRKNRYKRN